MAVEAVTLYQLVQVDRPLPQRYSRPLFWIVRLLVVIVAGGLAIAHDINKPILAANVGAAAPLIIQTLASNFKNR